MIGGIPRAAVSDAWPSLAPFLQNMCDRSLGRLHLEGVRARLDSGEWQAWRANDFQAVAITSIEAETVTIHAVIGSERSEWAADGLATIEDWARALGKKHLVVFCRPGWSGFLRGQGYRETHREFAREL